MRWTRLIAVLLICILPFIDPTSAFTLQNPASRGHGNSAIILSLHSGTDNVISNELQGTSHNAEPISLVDTKQKAFPQQTPHSGRHFTPSHPAYRRFWKINKGRKRFMEGWYYRLTIPEQNASFAIIISIEDAGNSKSPHKLACMQVIGPNDEYIVQVDKDDTKFWGWKHQQGLGCNFEYNTHVDSAAMRTVTAMSVDEWHDKVKSGFQILPTHFIGKIRGNDGTDKEAINGQGTPMSCDFNFAIEPLCGWGDTSNSAVQKSTGGWLASFAVFEPHWQVTLADARASGTVTWQGTTYTFQNAPFYAEKNWGAALPSKWYWTQCNAFPGYDQLSVTAGGGVRYIPFGRKESLGMVCVHYKGKFYEAVPWSGTMEWEVDTWGKWVLSGSSTFCDHPFEVRVTYECDPHENSGLVFRAPTPDEGMVFFCRDTFEATAKLTLWELEYDKKTKQYHRKPGPPLIDNATSHLGGAEVGGGPWWSTWKQKSIVKQPILTLLQLPVRLRRVARKLKRQ